MTTAEPSLRPVPAPEPRPTALDRLAASLGTLRARAGAVALAVARPELVANVVGLAGLLGFVVGLGGVVGSWWVSLMVGGIAAVYLSVVAQLAGAAEPPPPGEPARPAAAPAPATTRTPYRAG